MSTVHSPQSTVEKTYLLRRERCVFSLCSLWLKHITQAFLKWRCFMKNNKKEKDFDAVKMMRDAREKISRETEGMSFKELKEYIATRLKNSPTQSA